METVIFKIVHLCVQYLELHVEQTICCFIIAIFLISMHYYNLFLLLDCLEIIYVIPFTKRGTFSKFRPKNKMANPRFFR
jgi:hypothetical protein